MAHALDALVRLDVFEEMRDDLHECVRLRKDQRGLSAEQHSIKQDLLIGLLLDLMRCSRAVPRALAPTPGSLTYSLSHPRNHSLAH